MDEQAERSRCAEAFLNFMKLLQGESDRGSVIVSAAMLDDILLQLLKRRLAPSLEQKDELLEDGAAAFSTFSARIDLAYRLGLIKATTRASFHLVRKIRNDFAHISDPKTFNSSSVKSRALEIFKLNKDIIEAFSDCMKEHGLDEFKKDSFVEVAGTRMAYELFIAGIAAFLLEAINDIEHIEPFE